MSNSWLAHPRFFLVTMTALVLGNLFDMAGTYLCQPHFEAEGNPIHLMLARRGYAVGWVVVVTAKMAWCLFCGLGMRQFLRRRHVFYPACAPSFREFIGHFFWGRPLSWLETFYRVPRFLPSMLSTVAIIYLLTPIFFYDGYANFASKYGWWRLSGYWFRGFWIDSAVLIGVPSITGFFLFLIWQDFRSIQSKAGKMPVET